LWLSTFSGDSSKLFYRKDRIAFITNEKEGMEMRKSSEGLCRFCFKTFSGSTIGKHLQACRAKKERDVEETARAKKPERIFHIKVGAYGQFWLHIEMKGSSKLSDLDEFLRSIWLECCGHLSQFTIGGKAYMPSHAGSLEELDARSMGVQLGKVLSVKDKFEYEYDFGSTTHLEGQIVSEREGLLKEKVRILARNRIPEAVCTECGKPAVQFCTDCEEFYCQPCLDSHECGEEMALPVVNSPRMGVCGYTGEQDPDDFEPKGENPGKAARKRELPENLKKYLAERIEKNRTL
jgi:hypothetical protein